MKRIESSMKEWHAADLPPTVHERLTRYVDLLRKWQHVTNLISKVALREIWSRHIEDGIEVQRAFPIAKQWLDIGSGGGLPGVIIATLMADDKGAQVHCVESDSRKCVFLREVATQLRLPLRVYNARMETVDAFIIDGIDAVTARAFSPIGEIVKLAEPFLDRGARAVLPCGRLGESELTNLDECKYVVTRKKSSVDPIGSIVTVARRVRPIDAR